MQKSVHRPNGWLVIKGRLMSLHSYARCWLHLIWTTLDREPMLTRPAAVKTFLKEYAREKNIYLKINYFNAEHVHALIDLPTSKSIEEVVKLLKGSSSHWINQNRLLRGRFAWGRGYGAFSVSHSQVEQVAAYIAARKSTIGRRPLPKSLRYLLGDMDWNGGKNETVETVSGTFPPMDHLAEARC